MKLSCRPGDGQRAPAVEWSMGRGDLTDAEWERLRLFLLVSNGRCGRWRDHRQVIDGILHRVRTGVQWRDLPERFGPWKTVYERHRLWSAGGTWERLLQQVQAAADAAGEIGWGMARPGPLVRSGSARHPPGRRQGADRAGRRAVGVSGSPWPTGTVSPIAPGPGTALSMRGWLSAAADVRSSASSAWPTETVQRVADAAMAS
ncbi:transposase [Streptomyces sp. CAI 127]|nr:transposase [Streptomyces sp. CAI 127]